MLDGPLDVQYKKWQGAHWRLVSLAELEIPPPDGGWDLRKRASGYRSSFNESLGSTTSSRAGSATHAEVEVAPDASLTQFLRSWEHPLDAEGMVAPRVVVVDQFAEPLHAPQERWQERGPLFTRIADALADDPLLRVVIAIRRPRRESPNNSSVTCSRCAWTPAP